MTRMLRHICCAGMAVWLICTGSMVQAQPVNSTASDSVFTLNEFLFLVKNFHPVARQSNLVPEMARQEVRMARGMFDPVLATTYDNKTFDTKNYWSLLEAKLKVPTWFGISGQVGYQYFTGYNLNPSESTPPIGLPSAGVSVTLGKGLVMDERRAALKQAKLFAQASRYEQIILINDLYFEAIKKYWEWVYARRQQTIFRSATQLAYDRFTAIRTSFRYGEKPAIDTLEAYIVYQSRLTALQQADLDYQKAGLDLSNYLWKDEQTPLELQPTAVPPDFAEISMTPDFTQDSLNALLSSVPGANPVLRTLQFKADMLKVERLLKVNKLVPQIDVTYNFLYNDVSPVFFRDNYKFGVDFKFPLLLRQERGSLNLTKLKIQDNNLKIQQKTLEITNKIKAYHAEYQNLYTQLTVYRDVVRNYRTLLLAEISKFQIGESSVFMVNSRETKLIEAELKLAELQAKFLKAESGIYWAAGVLLYP